MGWEQRMLASMLGQGFPPEKETELWALGPPG